MNKLTVEIDGEKFEVIAQKLKGTLWYHLNGKTFHYNNVKVSKNKKSQKNISGSILAPMPGKIIKVKVCDKDEVSSGQVLILMEAMKMEYVLNSPSNGIVERLNVKEGDQVKVNQELCFVKSNGANK